MTSQLPFGNKPIPFFIVTVTNIKRELPLPEFGDRLHGNIAKDKMGSLLGRCLAYAPGDRPTAKEFEIMVSPTNIRPGINAQLRLSTSWPKSKD
jgi:hypothetical protein